MSRIKDSFWGLSLLLLIASCHSGQPRVVQNSTVLVQYNIKFTNGDRIDDNNCECAIKNGNPLRIRVGKNWVLKEWENDLLGMHEGEEKTLTLAPKNAFDTIHPPHEIKITDTLIFWFKIQKIE